MEDVAESLHGEWLVITRKTRTNKKLLILVRKSRDQWRREIYFLMIGWRKSWKNLL